jgi:general stress protein 26
MAQARGDGADLWFVTDIDTAKLDELASDPQVNVAYYNMSQGVRERRPVGVD